MNILDDFPIAKGTTLDKLGGMRFVTRKRFKTITLLFGWKLVKEEKDEDYRKRMHNIMKMTGRNYNE